MDMPSLETLEQPDSGMFVSAVVTEVPDNKSYAFGMFRESGTRNDLPFSKGDRAFIWLNGHPKDNIRTGMIIYVADLANPPWKKPGDKKYCANWLQSSQPELSAEPIEPVQQPEPTYESRFNHDAAIKKWLPLKSVRLKCWTHARLTVTERSRVQRQHLDFLAVSVGSPRSLEACIEFATTKTWFLKWGPCALLCM